MAILNTNISECNARLMSIEGQPQDAGFVIKRTWPWLQGSGTKSNDTHINTLYSSIAAITTVTNPKANNDSYAGLFVASIALAEDENADGTKSRASSIVQTLTRVKTVSTEASLGTPDKGSDKEILHYLDVRPGTDEHCYYIYRNLNPASRATAQSVSVSVPSGYDAELKREFKIEADKTGTLYIVFINRTWRGWTDTGADLKNYDNYNNAEQSINGLWARVKVADRTTATTNLLAATGVLAPVANHRVDNLTVSENGNGSLNFHRTDQKVIYQHSECWWTTVNGKDYTAWGRNGTDTQFRAVVTKLGGVNTSVGRSVSISKIPNKYTSPAQLYDWSIHKSSFTGNGVPGFGIGESAQTNKYSVKYQYAQIWNETLGRSSRCWRYFRTNWSLTWYATKSAAMATISGGLDGSRVISSITGLYGAVSVSSVDVGSNFPTCNDGKWTVDETIA